MEYCRAACRDTGDARYCILESTLGAILNWWDRHDESGGVPVEVVGEIERTLTSGVADVLGTTSAPDAGKKAHDLRDVVIDLLTEPDDWIRRGFVK